MCANLAGSAMDSWLMTRMVLSPDSTTCYDLSLNKAVQKEEPRQSKIKRHVALQKIMENQRNLYVPV